MVGILRAFVSSFISFLALATKNNAKDNKSYIYKEQMNDQLDYSRFTRIQGISLVHLNALMEFTYIAYVVYNQILRPQGKVGGGGGGCTPNNI